MIAIVLWFVVLGQAASPPQPLVGRWDAEARSKGGLGEWLVFSDDGIFARHAGAMLDGRWRLIGDVLTIDIGSASEQQSQTMTVELKDGTVRRSSHGVTQTLKRVGGGATASGLVGTWTYPHPSGRPAYEQFLVDGRYLFRVPMQTEAGRYAISGSTLTLTLNRARTASVEWRLDGDVLLLGAPLDSKDPARRFRRETLVPEMNRKR